MLRLSSLSLYDTAGFSGVVFCAIFFSPVNDTMSSFFIIYSQTSARTPSLFRGEFVVFNVTYLPPPVAVSTVDVFALLFFPRAFLWSYKVCVYAFATLFSIIHAVGTYHVSDVLRRTRNPTLLHTFRVRR